MTERMTEFQIRNIAATTLSLMQTGVGHFSVRLNEQWRFSFQMGSHKSHFCLIFSWDHEDGRQHSKTKQSEIDNEMIDWDLIVLWLMKASNKLEQWSK